MEILNIIEVTNLTKWVQSLGRGERSKGKLPNVKSCLSLSTIIYRENKMYAEKKCFNIRAHYFIDDRMAVIYTVPYEGKQSLSSK